MDYDLNLLSTIGGINDSSPPTLAEKYAEKNPLLMNAFGLESIYSQQKMNRLGTLMSMLRNKFPNLPFNQLLLRVTGMLEQFDNIEVQKGNFKNQPQGLSM